MLSRFIVFLLCASYSQALLSRASISNDTDFITEDEVDSKIEDAFDEHHSANTQLIQDTIEVFNQKNAECLSRGKFYNYPVHGCTSCSRCINHTEPCFHLCQGIFAKNELEASKEMTRTWFLGICIGGSVLTAAVIGLGVCMYLHAKRFEEYKNGNRYNNFATHDMTGKSDNDSFLDGSSAPLHTQASD